MFGGEEFRGWVELVGLEGEERREVCDLVVGMRRMIGVGIKFGRGVKVEGCS